MSLGLGMILLASTGVAAAATVWLVDGAGGGDYASIQAAIEGAQSGDQIAVGGRNVLRSHRFQGQGHPLRSTDGAESTTIDGTGHRHVVQ